MAHRQTRVYEGICSSCFFLIAHMIKTHCKGWQESPGCKSPAASTDNWVPSLPQSPLTSAGTPIQLARLYSWSELAPCSLPYLATKGVFLRPDHIAHHIAEVHAIGKPVGPSFIKRGVLVKLRQQIFICCFLMRKKSIL